MYDSPVVPIQIRRVPLLVHRVLKARAAREGLSLSDYLLREITALAERPTVREVMERAALRGGPALTSEEAARAIRAQRPER